jgi:hypothetical protein
MPKSRDRMAAAEILAVVIMPADRNHSFGPQRLAMTDPPVDKKEFRTYVLPTIFACRYLKRPDRFDGFGLSDIMRLPALRQG